MSLVKDIFIYLLIVGGAQGIQLSIFLWLKKENVTANKILSLLMIAFTINLHIGIFILSGYIQYFPQLIGISNTSPYIYGPMIYLYVRYLVHKEKKFNKHHLLHFIPFLLLQIYGVFFFYFESTNYIMDLLTPPYINPWHIELIGKGIPISGVIYTVLSISETIKYNRAIKSSYSNIDKINLQWLYYYVVGAAIIWGIVVVTYIVDFVWGEELQATVLIYVSLSIFMFAIGYRSLRQPELVEVKIDDDKKSEEQTSSYKKSGLSSDVAESILKELLQIMENKKPFLSSDLKLGDLAATIGASSHNLSEVINTKLNQNFYDFINKYRVEEVIKLLASDTSETYSILGLGYEAGFSSKSAFYSAFKKVTGKTPSEYRQENRAA
ncbi:MAG: helix-turn-helix domain-containing protein [bacterium]